MKTNVKSLISIPILIWFIFSFKIENHTSFRAQYIYESLIIDSAGINALPFQTKSDVKNNYRDSATLILNDEDCFLASFGRQSIDFFYVKKDNQVLEVNKSAGYVIVKTLENEKSNKIETISNEDSIYRIGNFNCYKRNFEKGLYKYEVFLSVDYQSSYEANQFILTGVIAGDELINYLANAMIVQLEVSTDYGKTIISMTKLEINPIGFKIKPLPAYKRSRKFKNLNKSLSLNERAYELIE
jgi:hypothetical protein